MAHQRHRRNLTWLALGTATLAVVMAVVLVLQFTQRQAIVVGNGMRVDSVSALAFQFEREFLRFRQVLDGRVNSHTPPDLETLTLRYDIFISRLNVLRDNPSTTELLKHPEVQSTLTKVDALIFSADPLLAQPKPTPKDLATLLAQANQLGPDVQAMSLSANSLIAQTVEQQQHKLLEQNNQILWLTGAQLALLLLAAAALMLWQRRQEQERLALEQMSDHLREAKLMADSANRSKTHFLTNMSHELRTPFNGILGMLGLLESTPLNAQQADHLSTAKESANQLLVLLNDLLDVASLETGNLSLNPGQVALPALLHDVQTLMAPLASAKKLNFTLHTPDNLPRWVHTDGRRLKQILINLIGNAFKFTPQGGVSVRVQPTEGARPNQGWEFLVQDTGIGMDASVLNRVFERFYQADSGLSRQHSGSGLGLMLSRTLARLLGGDITVTSTPNVGSVFTVRLPLAPCDGPAAPEIGGPVTPAKQHAPQHPPQPETSASPGAAAEPTHHKMPRVLVVEDHPVNSKFLGVLLTRLGCHADFCEDGQQSLNMVQHNHYDLVLMDVNMPVMDGLTATRAIRALGTPKAKVPIIIVTADVQNDAKDNALAAGANDFLSKPVQIAPFKAMLAQLLPQLQTPKSS